MTQRPYPVYRDSDVEWVGRLPRHWKLIRLKNALRLRTEKTDRRTNAVALENIEGWSGRRIDTESDFSGEGVAFETGDLLFGKLRPYLAKVLLADAPGEAVGDFHVLSPTEETFSRYAQYHILNRDFISVLDGSTYGAKMPRVSWDFMANMPFAYPPLPEQIAIAAFLDRETAKIDALMEEQKRLIELLKEKRQAVISHAVTKGLNPDARMKDSGIEWLGEVPEHWEVGRLKHSSEVRGRIGFRGYTADDLVAEEEGALTFGGANLSELGKVDLESRTYLSWHKYEESPEIKVERGDILLGQRGTCGRVSLVDKEVGPATINPSLVVLKNVTLDREFLTYWLMGDVIQKTFASYLSKTAVPMLSQQQIGNVPALRPPLDEQQSIARHVFSAVQKIDGLLENCYAGVHLLSERRSALISAAVTGKIDLRGNVDKENAA